MFVLGPADRSSITAILKRRRILTSPRTAALNLCEMIHPLAGSSNDYDLLLELIGDARNPARITQRLLVEKDFSAVAAEADWPDAYRVNRWARSVGGDSSASRRSA